MIISPLKWNVSGSLADMTRKQEKELRAYAFK